MCPAVTFALIGEGWAALGKVNRVMLRTRPGPVEQSAFLVSVWGDNLRFPSLQYLRTPITAGSGIE